MIQPEDFTVILTPAEAELAKTAGAFRRSESRRRKLPDSTFHENKLDADIQGAAAELAFAKLFKLYWGAETNVGKAPDFGKNIQIRMSYHDHGKLIIRKEDVDNKDHYFVLVVGTIPKFRIVGFIRGIDGMKDKYLSDPGGKGIAWFVPQEVLTKIRIITVKTIKMEVCNEMP